MKQQTNKKSIQILSHSLLEYNINKVVFSPGSRNAPLALHISENDDFKTYSIVDERSAGFVGMGMAKALRHPVAVCCTSGSAAVNYYPAVVEAFYQNIPLLLLTADRPKEFIDIFDGQTIRQKNIFEQHSYGNFELLEDSEDNAAEYNMKICQEAIETCLKHSGPVHINIPLKEPLYNMVAELPIFKSIKKNDLKNNYVLDPNLVNEWNSAKKTMILLGNLDPSEARLSQLLQMVKNHSCVVVSEANSNQFHEKFINHTDRYISNFSPADIAQYAPDLLICIGQNVVSKRVKEFLRQADIKNYWHINPYWQPATYGQITQQIVCKAEVFFKQLLPKINLDSQAYFKLWEHLKEQKDNTHQAYMEHLGYSDFYAYHSILKHLPDNYDVHFSNSSAIRYAQLLNYAQNNNIYCNRGTSGIDGCSSTAMGFAMVSENPVLLISGDISFLYDINALWNRYIPPYTRIIIINNGEGNIFKIIPGPDQTNAIDDLIATKHHHHTEYLAKHFGLDYFKAEYEDTLLLALNRFFAPSQKAKILEIDTRNSQNAKILKQYFEALK
jgi:2-succinyl-5-enolpyruvyl-6-hydroxy-3-cyclohexene-1-carboxylate synthase